MRRLVITTILLLSALCIKAQGPLEEEDHQVNLSSGYTNTGIPIFLSYELLVYNNISLSLEGSFRFYNEQGDSANYRHQIFGFSAYGNYYFNSMLNMDEKMGLYAGIHISYYKWFSPEEYEFTGNGSSTLAAGAQVGYRYYFGKHLGAFIEGLGDTQYVGGRLGLSYKFD